MGKARKTRTLFGNKLREELDRQHLSLRQLSRRMMPQRPEVARRNLSRWIAGTRPTRASRALVAATLGVDRSYFDEDDDEEGELADLVHALFQHIEQRVDRRLEQRLIELGLAAPQSPAEAERLLEEEAAAPDLVDILASDLA
jgi:transcriptional regulator with XRE-family HTH domain